MLDELRQKLVTENLDIVSMVISKSFRKYAKDKDFKQTGLEILCRAADKWSGQGNFKAYAWTAIQRGLIQEARTRETRKIREVSLNKIAAGDSEFQKFFPVKIDVLETLEVDLSKTEQEILDLLSTGRTPSDIAILLERQTGTIYRHIRNIQKKISEGEKDGK